MFPSLLIGNKRKSALDTIDEEKDYSNFEPEALKKKAKDGPNIFYTSSVSVSLFELFR